MREVSALNRPENNKKNLKEFSHRSTGDSCNTINSKGSGKDIGEKWFKMLDSRSFWKNWNCKDVTS